MNILPLSTSPQVEGMGFNPKLKTPSAPRGVTVTAVALLQSQEPVTCAGSSLYVGQFSAE